MPFMDWTSMRWGSIFPQEIYKGYIRIIGAISKEKRGRFGGIGMSQRELQRVIDGRGVPFTLISWRRSRDSKLEYVVESGLPGFRKYICQITEEDLPGVFLILGHHFKAQNDPIMDVEIK
jgi:hypothetical protein